MWIYMANVYHLDLNKRVIQGAEVALLPGDPARSQFIAEYISRTYRRGFKRLASKREFFTCLADTGRKKVIGASTHYAPIEYPAVAHYEVVNALIGGAEKAGIRYHAGVTASSDTFYPGEERKDSFRKYILRRFKGSTAEWKELNVLNYVMEASTILTIAASMGLRGGCVTGVVNRGGTGKITKESLREGEQSAIKVAVAALEWLV